MTKVKISVRCGYTRSCSSTIFLFLLNSTKSVLTHNVEKKTVVKPKYIMDIYETKKDTRRKRYLRHDDIFISVTRNHRPSLPFTSLSTLGDMSTSRTTEKDAGVGWGRRGGGGISTPMWSLKLGWWTFVYSTIAKETGTALPLTQRILQKHLSRIRDSGWRWGGGGEGGWIITMIIIIRRQDNSGIDIKTSRQLLSIISCTTVTNILNVRVCVDGPSTTLIMNLLQRIYNILHI